MTLTITRRTFGPHGLLEIEADGPGEWEAPGADYLRVSLPAGRAGQAAMEKRGFTWGDRTLGVTIRPRQTKIDYGKLVRLQPEVVPNLAQAPPELRSEILALAQSSFPTDRRFHLAPDYDQDLADLVIKSWVEELSGPVLVARVKGEVAGFLALKLVLERPSAVEIHLAAVGEKYRLAGVALSMYGAAVAWASAQGYESVTGRISSLNMPVMNLYSYLGATFEGPLDVYLKVLK